MRYIPHTLQQKEDMLNSIGVKNINILFEDIPKSIRLKDKLNLPNIYSELELTRYLKKLSSKNVQEFISFSGGGCYDHFIPAVVDYLSSRAEFYTAYTPYQPEVSQGTLQAIYEYQTFICLLTGMDVTNASLYDGASAVAEAVLMANRIKGKSKVVVSETVNPEYLNTLSTYLEAIELELEKIPYNDGVTNLDELSRHIDEETFAVVIQVPNFFGCIEDVEKINRILHSKNVLLIVSVDPISLGLIVPPVRYGADIVVGDGQSLGNYQSFGGPTFGFLATKNRWIRNLPGRLVGKTLDKDGKEAFTLTLQTREQHIRRQRATSNICSNQSLNALRGAIYCALMGSYGFNKVSNFCFTNAHYLAEQIGKLNTFDILFSRQFFKEFAVKAKVDVDKLNETLYEEGIIGGINLSKYYPELENYMLVAVTEKRTKEEMDKFVKVLAGI